MNTAVWHGGPHNGLRQWFWSDGLPEWRTCYCHGVAYRFVGIVEGVHYLQCELPQIAGKAFEAKSMAEKEGFEPSMKGNGPSKRPGLHPCDVDLQTDLQPKPRERRET